MKERKEKDTSCTQCGGDAWVAVSNVVGPDGVVVGKKERLCLSCAKKRGCPDFIGEAMNGFCEVICEVCGRMIANREVNGVAVCDDCYNERKGENNEK